MKALRAFAIFTALIVVSGLLASPARADVSFGFFHSGLSPHGSWLVSAEYGRVWRPSVYRSGWHPYHDGRWAYTDVGWTWVSDYSWGGIPYHYGTWSFDPILGWIWVPGYTWAPAWVVFRSDPEYVGWAPVPPGFSIGASFNLGGSAAGPFIFVSARDFLAPRIRTCVLPSNRLPVLIQRTRVVNSLRIEKNIVVNRGLDPRHIERASGRKIHPSSIERVPRAAPGERFRREDLGVDPQRARGGLRAAEPEAVRGPAKVSGERGTGVSGRRGTAAHRSAVSSPALRARPQPPARAKQASPSPSRERQAGPAQARARQQITPAPSRGREMAPSRPSPHRSTAVTNDARKELRPRPEGRTAQKAKAKGKPGSDRKN